MSLRKKKPFRLFKPLLAMAFFLVVLLVSLVYFVLQDKNVTAAVHVETAPVEALVSPLDGRIVAVHASAGQYVPAGHLLVAFDTTAIDEQIAERARTVEELKALCDLAAARLSVIEKTPLPNAYRFASLDLDTARRQLEHSQQQRVHYQRMFKKSLVPKTEMDRADMAYYQDRANYEKARQNNDVVEHGLANAVVSRARMELNLTEVRLRGARDKLKTLNARREQYMLRTAVPARVVSWTVKAQTSVRRGDLLGHMALDVEQSIAALKPTLANKSIAKEHHYDRD